MTDDTTTRTLADHHYRILSQESAISDEIITQRGYFTVTTSQAAAALGFSRNQARQVDERKPALIIPYYKPDGTNSIYCMRPDNPRVIDQKKKGKLPDGTYPQKVFKYEMPKGVGNVLDCHPTIISHLKDPARPLIFTEGAKKADSLISHGYLAINLNGVYGWRGTSSKTQGKTALSDFEDIALNGRKCYLVFDSDVMVKDEVKGALRRLRSYLLSKDAQVIPVILPHTDMGKTGIDDYFASGKTAADLNALLTMFEAFPPHLSGYAQKKWTTEKIRDWYLDQGYTFAINDMNEILSVNGERVDDTKRAIIRTRLRDGGLPLEHAEDTSVLMGDECRYHPIKAYLESVTWNGEDTILALSRYLPDKHGLLHMWLKRFLTGAVARVYEDGTRNVTLILNGPENIGKSTFVRWLCPLTDLHCESRFDPDSNDTELRMVNHWIWELGELGNITRRADRDAFKRALTEARVTVRRPYGRFDLLKPVTCSFVGTVNPDEPFLDMVGKNTRFVVAELITIDFKYEKEIEIDQVWAQAYHMYRNGDDWRLDSEERSIQNETNEEYRIENPFVSLIKQKFDIDPNYKYDRENVKCLTTVEIVDWLGKDSSKVGLVRTTAAALRRIGLCQSNARRLPDNDYKERYWDGITKKHHL